MITCSLIRKSWSFAFVIVSLLTWNFFTYFHVWYGYVRHYIFWRFWSCEMMITLKASMYCCLQQEACLILLAFVPVVFAILSFVLILGVEKTSHQAMKTFRRSFSLSGVFSRTVAETPFLAYYRLLQFFAVLSTESQWIGYDSTWEAYAVSQTAESPSYKLVLF